MLITRGNGQDQIKAIESHSFIVLYFEPIKTQWQTAAAAGYSLFSSINRVIILNRIQIAMGIDRSSLWGSSAN